MNLNKNEFNKTHLEASPELWNRIQKSRQKSKPARFAKPLAWAALIPLIGALYFSHPTDLPSPLSQENQDAQESIEALSEDNLYLDFYAEDETTELSYVDDFYQNL